MMVARWSIDARFGSETECDRPDARLVAGDRAAGRVQRRQDAVVRVVFAVVSTLVNVFSAAKTLLGTTLDLLDCFLRGSPALQN